MFLGGKMLSNMFKSRQVLTVKPIRDMSQIVPKLLGALLP